MVATADKLVAMMRAAGQGRAGGLMLGHNSSVSAGNLRATLMSWREAHPDVEVECVEADRSVLLAGLDTGEIDVAILMGTAGLCAAEEQAMAKLSHPNVVTVYDVDAVGELVYVAMDSSTDRRCGRGSRRSGAAGARSSTCSCAPAGDWRPRTPPGSSAATSSPTTSSGQALYRSRTRRQAG
jgi:DNA-binding transcriptional LysR family regulator